MHHHLHIEFFVSEAALLGRIGSKSIVFIVFGKIMVPFYFIFLRGSASMDLDAGIWYLGSDSHDLVSRSKSGSQDVEAGIWHPGYDSQGLPSMIW